MQTTARSQSFIEVLEAEIRADLRKEMESEVQFRKPANAPSQAVHAAGRLETWLASHVGPIIFAKPVAARKSYGVVTRPVAARPPVSELTFTATTPEELFAVEMLNRASSLTLSPSFTEDELKAVWRKAALKTHPDRFASADQITQMRMTVLFRELAEAYECLSNILDKAA